MTLAWYIVRSYVGAVAAVHLGLVIVLVAVGLVEEAGRLTAHGDGATTLRLAFFSGVAESYVVWPVSLFVGALVSATLLGRRGELLAMASSGVSVFRIGLIFAGVAVVGGGLGVACGETWVPGAEREASRIRQEELRRGDTELGQFFARRQRWYQDGDHILFLPHVHGAKKVAVRPVIFELDHDQVSTVTEGKRLRYTEAGGWVMTDAVVRSVEDGGVVHHPRLPLSLSVASEDLIEVTGNPRHLPSAEVGRLIERRRRAGFDTTPHEVELQTRFAHPFLGLALLCVVAPWLLGPSRRRSLAGTLGAGVVVVALVLSVTQALRLLALGRTFAPWMAAWGVILLCLMVTPAVARFVALRR